MLDALLTSIGLGGGDLALFMLAALALNATPGVDFALTVSRTLQAGARAGAAAALGIGAGCAVHALAAAFGLAALLALWPALFAAVQWAGAAWLAWLGLKLLRDAWRPPVAAVEAAPGRSLGAEFRTGLATNLLNPKVALFFLAFVPQFIPAGSAHKTLAFVALGAVFVVQGLVFLFGLVALSVRLRRLGASPRVAAALRALGGVVFVALAARLAGTRA